MQKNKDSVILYESFFEATEDLSPESVAEIWRGMKAYINGNEPIFATAEAKIAWKFIRLQLDADAKKYAAKCAKNKESIAMRWQKNEEENKQKIQTNTDEYECKKPDTKHTDTDTDTDTDIIINNNNKGDKSPFDFFSLLPESFGKSERFRAAWVAWLKYRRERKLAKWTESTLRKKAKEFTEWGVDKTVQAIDEAISNSWQGVFVPKTPPKPTVDHYTLQRAFEWAEGHFLGDYDSDPITATQLDRWASDNGVYDRLKQPLDPMYKHVFKTKR